MATIGTFTCDGDGFTGNIATLALKAKTVIKAVEKASDHAPDFRVYAAGVEIGAAWVMTGEKSGKRYLSIKLDDPSFVAPIHSRLVGIDGDSQTLIWDR